MKALRWAEDSLLALTLGAMVVLPLLEVFVRSGWRVGIAGGSTILQHLSLVVAMLGAAIAAREGRLLVLSNVQSVLDGHHKRLARWAASLATATVGILLAYGAWVFVHSEWQADTQWFGEVPAWIIQWVMPVGFAVIALRSLWAGGTTPWQRLSLALLCALCVAVFYWDVFPRQHMVTLGLCMLGLAAMLGAAVFAVLGGVAILLFWGQELPIASLAVDHYRLVVNPALPAIPLFTLAGYFLAEGGAPARLVRVFRAGFGNRSGGAAAVTVGACAFFTAFTGASGVAILALGGLLLPLLVASGQSQRSALGLVTSAGSLGVLLPPSLPLILYAVVAKVPLRDLFLSALFPALLLLSLAFLWARWAAARVPPVAGVAKEPLGPALRAAQWELLLPVVAFAALFGGWATPVEAAAITALYAFVVEVYVYRGLSLWSDIPRVAAESGLLVGGVLLILGVALGLTNFLADAQVPDRMVEWVRANIDSKWVFLLALNVFLLAVGCLMDIFSAIVVVVPLIVPLGVAFGVDPIHLGIIFLANMELGYLTPPVGMNLYFASYRFGRPLGEVAWASFPYVLVLDIGVLVITYAPWLSMLYRSPPF